MGKIYYAGIGSSKTPPETLNLMTRIAEHLAVLGYVLRSGAAQGADQAFEQGCLKGSGEAEIWLPWADFNGHPSTLLPCPEAFTLASTYHPAWGKLSNKARAFHARNCHQVLGVSLSNLVSFVVCWTPDGCESKAERTLTTGGTGTAIELASCKNIPVFNLQKGDALARLCRYLDELQMNTGIQTPRPFVGCLAGPTSERNGLQPS